MMDSVSPQLLLSTLNNMVQAINNLNQTLSSSALNNLPITGSSGGSSGNFGTVIGDDGQPYKIPLDLP